MSVSSQSGSSNDLGECTKHESSEEGMERGCDTMLMCILTTLNNGLRSGGGIGDVLRKPKSSVYNTNHIFLMAIIL